MGQIKNIKLHIVTDIKTYLRTLSGWVHTNTCKNCTRRNRAISYVSCSVSDVGSSAILLPFTVRPDPRVPTKRSDWATGPSRATSSTESAYDEVAERSPCLRERRTVNLNAKVSTKSSFSVVLAQRLRREQEGWLEPFVCLVRTGYVRIPHTCTTK